MKTTQQDMKSMNLSLNEATDVAQNRPLWRLIDVYVWRYALIVEHARNEFDTAQTSYLLSLQSSFLRVPLLASS